MPTSTFQVVDEWPNYVGRKVVDLTSDVFKLFLTNSAPTKAGTQVKADLTPITVEHGYTEAIMAMTWAETAAGSGIWRLSMGADKTWTASGGTFGPFRYVVLYDDTPTSPADPVVGFFDYGSALTVNAGDSFVVNVDADFAIYTTTVN